MGSKKDLTVCPLERKPVTPLSSHPRKRGVTPYARAFSYTYLGRILLTNEMSGDRTSAKNRIHVEKLSMALGATERGGIRREEPVGERNRREGKNARGITIRRQQSIEVSQIPRLHVAVFLG